MPMQSPISPRRPSSAGALNAAQIARDEPEPTRVPLRLIDRAAGVRLFGIRVLNYLTNHVVTHVPSFTLRHLWYRHAMGIQLGEHVGLHLGTYVWFNGPRETRRKGVRIGQNSKINRDCTLDVRGGLTIGANVSVSAEVMILSAYHDLNDPRFSEVKRPVAIEDYVFVGARAIVLPGVTVGRGAVVAAGAVVTKDVPPLTVVAGVPATPIGMRDPDALVYEFDGPLWLFE